MASARRSPATVRRNLQSKTCITNFYPIQFLQSGDVHLRISIFHCTFYDAAADQPMLPREETELKRTIFEVPRTVKRQRAIEDALGVKTLEFGGDCAAGLRVDSVVEPESALQIQDLIVDEVDSYEVNYAGDWTPCIVRDRTDDETINVELYAPGSFWSEMLNRAGPFPVAISQVRRRQWEVCRGEVLRIPDGEVLTLRKGQHLWVQSRGPGQDEPAGRLEMGEGAALRCDGGSVDNEGVLACMIALQHPQYGHRRYKVEIESTKTVLVDCSDGIPDLPLEERGVALQCFMWIFERAYRQMQLRTLGGRGWYLADEGAAYPKRPVVLAGNDRRLAPRVFLYKGFIAAPAYVSRGPCLKVDLSVRIIQGQTALAKLNFFRDMMIDQRQSRGLPDPTKEEVDAFLQKQMVGRTCMSRHNQIHYRIHRVCIEMDPTATFPFEDGEITYLEYFQRRHGITLQRKQPMLYCPFRAKQEVYLPAEIAFLTGLDEDWKAHKEFSHELWQDLRHAPREHWKLQAKLMEGLTSEEHGRSLQEWGVSVDAEPVRVEFNELEHEPVYFSRESEAFFCKLKTPPAELEVSTSQHGFDKRPWPEVWLPPGGRLVLDRWLIFCSSQQDEIQAVERFVAELEPMVGELLEAAGQEGRLIISRPTLVPITANSSAAWSKKVTAYQPPWPLNQTKFAMVIIPGQSGRREQYYYQLKTLLTFHWGTSCPTQMVLSGTLQRETQRQQVWRSILQQILVKQGAFLWVMSPLPYSGRSTMVVGIDTIRASKDSPAYQALCASHNVYFTSYFTSWRVQANGDPATPPGPMLREALLFFYDQMGRMPDTVIVYRGGVSESQEALLLEVEVHHPQAGILQTLQAVAEEIAKREGNFEELRRWKDRSEVAYIMARRSMNTRFRTEEWDNLPSGSYVDKDLIPENHIGGETDSMRFDFYMVSQTYVIGTAKPTLYTALYNTLSLSRHEIIQLTYRLCGVYMTFAGMVSIPAPLKYASKLLSLLSKCSNLPPQPTGAFTSWRPNLFFV
eukprot:TRINITY_DN29205_c0_g1_i1.p1 TRINITY_DN29205_c0_g1~~TRINITY_DN29205_c0_g1_i1.p1  ORF type:complete len:1021 (-),score=208.80 TRINITY_DN29205_c0_g1_i1:207-3269(-)